MIALELAAIALGAVVIAVGLRVSTRDPVITGRLPQPGSPAPSPPAQLIGIERLVSGVSRAADVHHRLRPVLQEIAAARLRGRGVRLDLDPDRARRLLGDELWEIVRPERPLPEDRFGAGLSSAELRRLIERLEAL